MTLFGISVVALLLSVGTLLAIRDPWRALLWSCALLPWFGLDMDIGLRITAFQLFVLPLIAIYTIRGFPVPITVGNCVAPLALFVGYAIFVSATMLPFLPEVEVGGGLFRSPIARSITQLFMLLFVTAPLLIAAHLCRSRHLLIGLARIYVNSSLMLAAIGYLQMFIWLRTGNNPIPISYFDSLVTGTLDQYRSGMFVLDGLDIYRINSFAGEPKNLGQALVIALLLLMCGLNAGVGTREFVLKAVFLLVAIFLTQSTSAFILLAAGLVFLTFTGVLHVSKWRQVIRLMAAGAIATVVGAVLVNIWLELPILDLIAARTSERFSEQGFSLLDDFDKAVVDFLVQDWIALLFGVGLGNVHLFADAFLAPDVAVFASGTSFVAKTGFLRLVSETGIFGALIFLLFVCRLWNLSSDDRTQSTRAIIAIAVLSYLLVAHVSLFFILAGATIGMISVQRRSAAVKRVASPKVNQLPVA